MAITREGLDRFCIEDEPAPWFGVEHKLEPFSDDRYTYAVNGATWLRVGLMKDVPVNKDDADFANTLDFDDSKVSVWKAGPLLSELPPKAKGYCGACSYGTGQILVGRRFYKCNDCFGAGLADKNSLVNIESIGAKIMDYDLRRICALPNVVMAVGAAPKPPKVLPLIRFRFDGGVGMSGLRFSLTGYHNVESGTNTGRRYFVEAIRVRPNARDTSPV